MHACTCKRGRGSSGAQSELRRCHTPGPPVPLSLTMRVPLCHGFAWRKRGQPSGDSETRTRRHQTPSRRSPAQCLPGARQGEASPPLDPRDLQLHHDCRVVAWCMRVVPACALATEVSTRLALRVTTVHYSQSVKKREEPVSALGSGLRPSPHRLSTPLALARAPLSPPVGDTSTTSYVL